MPNSNKPVVIAGAGPAGSTLAIRLRHLGLPVTLIERYKFPRQKLCGEFISPECLLQFKELGVLNEMLEAGGDHIYETRFFETGGRSISIPSGWFDGDGYALSLSRSRMDEILLNAARESGVRVFEETTVTGLSCDSDHVRGVRIRSPEGNIREINASMVIDATGRARVLSRMAEKPTQLRERKARFIGFKAHLRGVSMPRGVCEIYAFRGGYAGLSWVEGDEANLCLLGKASMFGKVVDADRIVESHLKLQNKRAAITLSHAEKVHDWLAVSVPYFGIHEPANVRGLYAVGDSAAFVDPFTGSGMLMAIESSKLFADAVAANGPEGSRLEADLSDIFKNHFKARLNTSRSISWAAYEPRWSTAVVRLLSASGTLRSLLARKTRPRPLSGPA